MAVKQILEEIEKKMGISAYQLGKLLKLKSPSHIYRLKNGIQIPTIRNATKIIETGKKAGMNITMDMFYE